MSTEIYDELILTPTNRVSVIPLDPRYTKLWDNYLIQIGSLWTHLKISFKDDVKHWEKMPEKIKSSTKKVLAYFATSDRDVENVLSESQLTKITVPEYETIANAEKFMEDVHAIVYNNNIIAYVPNIKEREAIFNAVDTMESVAGKARWARQWITDERSITYTIIGKACVEAINFSSSFAWIDWLKSRGYKLPGLYLANEEISRDERRHVVTSVLVYELIKNRLEAGEVKQIFEGSLKVENVFIEDIIDEDGFINMTRNMMKQHVLHCAYKLAVELGYPDILPATNSPFDFIVGLRNYNSKANFFEVEDGNYGQFEAADSYEESDDF